MKLKKQKGFSLIELLVVIAIIGVLSSIVLSAVNTARTKARDVKRKAEISGIGRLVTASCYLPNDGAGDYDIVDLIVEFATTHPQYTSYISRIPRDPSAASSGPSLYMYVVNSSGKCAVYANLENDSEAVTLPSISAPTAGGGTGVLEASAGDGWNGSSKYFQVSN